MVSHDERLKKKILKILLGLSDIHCHYVVNAVLAWIFVPFVVSTWDIMQVIRVLDHFNPNKTNLCVRACVSVCGTTPVD